MQAAKQESIQSSFASSTSVAAAEDEPQVAIYFFGDAFTSPFDVHTLNQAQKDNGIMSP